MADPLPPLGDFRAFAETIADLDRRLRALENPALTIDLKENR